LFGPSLFTMAKTPAPKLPPSPPLEAGPIDEGHTSDDERLKALIAWFKRHGSSLLTGVTLGLVLVLGWQFYQRYQLDQALTASNHYDALLAAVERGDAAAATELYALLEEDYAGTYYAELGALLMAREAALAGDDALAVDRLQAVVEDAAAGPTADLARVRLARALMGLDRLASAEAQLDAVADPSFAAAVAETRGDLHLLRGELALAREAYDAAIAARGPDRPSPWLEVKRRDLTSGAPGPGVEGVAGEAATTPDNS
ncbi:MAG: YfgM family protein, partial [Candidatus Competibacterales bacterium]